ncbi:hypothetical protein [Aquamicrobium sp.]|uniref:hypothetical protein n=1 Tax=Aquamicrobium sp. TaxID=1872579 RepID=UPI00258CC945|nr:hypothetical protein [Aquamicrobium sp.]MCK9552253.1 hypothetical protein [Aquamicrobium sp.]
MCRESYSALMGEQKAHLTLKLDTDEPIELGDFVGAFTSIANEFDRYVSETYPGVKADTRMYVREVRHGCVEADIVSGLIPAAVVAAGAAVHSVEQIMLLEDFVRRWGGRLKALITNDIPKGELENIPQLNDFHKTVRSIIADPNASHRLDVAYFEDGERKIKSGFKFTTPEARAAEQNIEDRKRLLAQPDTSSHSRVLMVYTRTDVHDAAINKKSGERVRIESLSPKDHAVMYASEMVEQEIRQQIRDADENVYKRGFVVDVSVQKAGERIVAYAVTAFHSVIELE